MSAPDALLLFEKRQNVAWLTLNRPQVLNAVNMAMRDELWQAMLAVRDDPEVKAVVIRGAGRSFCAGADITEFGTAPSYLEAREARHERDLWALVLSIPKPIIAAIQGHAYGAGCEMSLCCDLRVASEDAVFALPETNLGYIPSAGGTQLLPRFIGPAAALGMILSAEPIGAARALQLGLVQRVVPREHLDYAVEELATLLAAQPPAAMAAAKRVLAEGQDLPLVEALALTARVSEPLLSSH